jgi:hypothetical protein
MDNMKNISITKGIADSLKSQRSMAHSVGGIICTVCKQPLTDPISEEAGKGPVCRERVRFTEKLKREDISFVEGKLEDFATLRSVPHDGIVRIVGEEHPRFVNIIINEESFAAMIDRTESADFYDNDPEISYTDSIIKSFYVVDRDRFSSISRMCEPKSEAMEERFNNFKQEYKDSLKDRDTSSPSPVGYSVKSSQSLDEDQLENRKKFQENYKVLKKNPTNDNNNRFIPKLQSGEYSIATMMARLQNSQIPGSSDLLASMQDQYADIKPKDYGLTDKELVHGLTIAIKKQEKSIFMAMLRGTGDFSKIAKVYKDLQKQRTPELLKLFTDITT